MIVFETSDVDSLENLTAASHIFFHLSEPVLFNTDTLLTPSIKLSASRFVSICALRCNKYSSLKLLPVLVIRSISIWYCLSTTPF